MFYYLVSISTGSLVPGVRRGRRPFLSILIGQLYYGCSQAAEGRSWGADPLFLRKNRPSKNKPIMSHDSNRCQACIESLCVINNSAMLSSL